MEETVEVLRSMPPSARLLLKVIKEIKIADFKRLQRETLLSRRALMYSIKTLKDLGLIDTQICLNDTRRRFYCVRLKSNKD